MRYPLLHPISFAIPFKRATWPRFIGGLYVPISIGLIEYVAAGGPTDCQVYQVANEGLYFLHERKTCKPFFVPVQNECLNIEIYHGRKGAIKTIRPSQQREGVADSSMKIPHDVLCFRKCLGVFLFSFSGNKASFIKPDNSGS